MHEQKPSCKNAHISRLCGIRAEKMGAQSFLCRNLKLDVYVIHFCCMPARLLIKLKPFLDKTCCKLSEAAVFLFSSATLDIPAHYLITNQWHHQPAAVSISCWSAALRGLVLVDLISELVLRAGMWGELQNECVVTCLAGWQLLLQLVLHTHTKDLVFLVW